MTTSNQQPCIFVKQGFTSSSVAQCLHMYGRCLHTPAGLVVTLGLAQNIEEQLGQTPQTNSLQGGGHTGWQLYGDSTHVWHVCLNKIFLEQETTRSQPAQGEVI